MVSRWWRNNDRVAPRGPIQFRLVARTEVITTDEGRELTGSGYEICDARTGAPLGEDDFFFRIGGGIVCDLSGGEDHIGVLQSHAFDPGESLTLVRAHETIEVRDRGGVITVGHLPADITEAVAFSGQDAYHAALCLWEWRDEDGVRFTLRLLLAPGWTTEQLGDGAAPADAVDPVDPATPEQT